MWDHNCYSPNAHLTGKKTGNLYLNLGVSAFSNRTIYISSYVLTGPNGSIARLTTF